MKNANLIFAALTALLILAVACGAPAAPVVPATPTQVAVTAPSNAKVPTNSSNTAPTATTTSPPVPTGWRYYAARNFQVALPLRWHAVDIQKDGIAPVLDWVNTLRLPNFARNITASVSSANARQHLKFWAIDSQSAGSDYPIASVTFQTVPNLSNILTIDLCQQLQTSDHGPFQLIETKCGLVLNKVDAFRFTLRTAADTPVYKSYQYYYRKGDQLWIMNLFVDENAWSDLEPTFNTMAELFRPE